MVVLFCASQKHTHIWETFVLHIPCRFQYEGSWGGCLSTVETLHQARWNRLEARHALGAALTVLAAAAPTQGPTQLTLTEG